MQTFKLYQLMPRIHKTLKETEAVRNAKVKNGILFFFSYYDCVSTMYVNSHVDDLYLFITVCL